MGWEQPVVDFIEAVYQVMSWPGVVLFMAIESACIPLPSELIMPLSGWLLIENEGLGVGYVFLAGFFGALGNTIGSVIAYWVGAWGGRPFLLRYGRYLLITRHDVELADRWFQRWGDATIFFSRLLPVVRTFISLPAGIARMSMGRFLVLTFVGSFPWSVGLAYGGFLLGQNWERLRAAMRPFDIPILVVALLLVGFLVWRRVRGIWAE